MSVSEGLPSAEASESNDVTIKKRRVTKKPFQNSEKFNFYQVKK